MNGSEGARTIDEGGLMGQRRARTSGEGGMHGCREGRAWLQREACTAKCKACTRQAFINFKVSPCRWNPPLPKYHNEYTHISFFPYP
jgi:hypothetical protein